MEQIPPHVATFDEPIPEMSGQLGDGPDLRRAIPIEVMLGTLSQLRLDHYAYLKVWLALVKSVGVSISLTISRKGDEELRFGMPCDAQERHRNRWLHFLGADLKSEPERRDLLISILLMRGHYLDGRPAEPRSTTRAVRDFLTCGGRIMIKPDGTLIEGAEIPRAYVNGSESDAAECDRASRAYFAVRRRWRSDRQIKRAVNMLGERTDNGWVVLEARS